MPRNAQTHEKIAIDGNTELDSFPDKIGLGTLADPYIIANYTIDASNIGSGVSIQNTDRYLILQNLTISNSAGYGTGSGIYLNNVNNFQIESCQTPSNHHGVYLANSANCTITNTTISDSTYGVRLISSENISLFDNQMTGCGLYLEGDLDSQVSHISSNNTVNNRSLYWYVNEKGLSAPNFTSSGQIILVNCTDADITDQNLTSATVGLQLLSTKNSRITNVTANEGEYGFYFDTGALNNTIVNCTTSVNRFYGQFLDSSNTTVINCKAFENNYHGFLLDFPGEFNNIIDSKASNNNGNGIHISNSVNNTITNCTTSGNAQYGLEIFSSEFNTIINSTLSTNTQKGLYFRSSDQNRVVNCIISGNFGYGVNIEDSHSNIFSNCISMGNSFYGIYLDNSNSNDIINATISDNTNGGIVLSSSDGNEIGNCSTWNNPYGYYLYDSSYNHISNSTAINNQLHGIYLYSFSQHNTVSNCFIDSNTHTGIRIQFAANWNQISNCSASKSQYGLSIDESYYNDITQNDIYDNENGFYLSNGAFDNVFWDNWILRNALNQALDNSGINQWDYVGTGNYWDDYFDRYPSAIIVDGYWNLAYTLNGSAGAQDNFPIAAASVLPGPPSVLTLNQTIFNSSLLIKWTAVSDTTTYKIYINGTLNATTSTTQHLVYFGTIEMYEITATAVNASGESAPSNAILIIVENPPPVPEPPIILTPGQTIIYTSLLVEWTAVPDTTSYKIYVNGTLNATTSTTQQLVQLGMNGRYEITVTAVNTSGESDPSSAVVIVVEIPPLLPESPTILSSGQTITDTSLLIEWTSVPGATSYNVYVNGILNATTANMQQIVQFGSNGTYEITVTAVNTSGESTPSSAIIIMVEIPPLLPESPTIFTSGQTIIDFSLLIEWTSVPGATSYNVYVNGILNATTANMQQIVQFGSNGMYEITVTAVNASGESTPSSAIIIMVEIPPLLPESPTILTSEQTITNESLLVEWTSVPGSEYYNVYVNGTLNATSLNTLQLIPLGTNGVYEISVTAVNSSGESGLSTPILITVAISWEDDTYISSYPIGFMLIIVVITSMKLHPRKKKLQKKQN